MKLLEEIEGYGNVFKVNQCLSTVIGLLKEYGAEVIGLRDMAFARLHAGKDVNPDGMKLSHPEILQHGCLTREAVIYSPREDTLFVSDSPILNSESAWQAVRAHIGGKEYVFYPEHFVDLAKEDKDKEPQERRVLIVKDYENQGTNVINIPTNRFGEEELTLWAFKDVASDYGLLLKELYGVEEMPVVFSERSHIDEQEQPFLRQTHVGGVYYDDENAMIHNSVWFKRADNIYSVVFGLSRQDFIGIKGRDDLYTRKQISAALEKLKLIGVAKQLKERGILSEGISTLEDVSEGLKRLGLDGLEEQICRELKGE